MQNNKKVLGGVILIVLVAVMGFLVWKANLSTSQVDKLTGVEDETANWKTYTNDTYGFRFEYPKEWIVVEGASTVTLSSDIEGIGALGTNLIASFELVVKAVPYSSFGEHRTKLGTFAYDSKWQSLIEWNGEKGGYECASHTTLTRDSKLPVFYYGGSTMSDPSYENIAILTNKDYLLDLYVSYAFPVDKLKGDSIKDMENRVLNSLSLVNSVQSRVPICSPAY